MTDRKNKCTHRLPSTKPSKPWTTNCTVYMWSHASFLQANKKKQGGNHPYKRPAHSDVVKQLHQTSAIPKMQKIWETGTSF
jgi:hypothetical protein